MVLCLIFIFKELQMIRSPKLIKTLLAAALAATAFAASAQEKVTVQLKWVAQSQFAGYYVAAAKGYYKEAGLDVTIKPGGPDISPVQALVGKQADIAVNWMPDALAAREASGIQFTAMSACLPTRACTGEISGPPGLMVTSRPASL